MVGADGAVKADVEKRAHDLYHVQRAARSAVRRLLENAGGGSFMLRK
jgi:hypothetical protein